MILLVHMLFGAAIGNLAQNIPLAIILAFLSHYFLDVFPHIEYDIEIMSKKQWQDKLASILKITLDLFAGLALISIFSNNHFIIYVCTFFSILPDGFTVLNNHFTNKLLRANYILHQKIHFLKNKQFSVFWRIASQITFVLISLLLILQN